MFKNMRMSITLGAGFGIILLIFVGCVGYGYLGMQEANTAQMNLEINFERISDRDDLKFMATERTLTDMDIHPAGGFGLPLGLPKTSEGRSYRT